MKFGYFWVIPEGKIRLDLQEERFIFAFRENHESGNPHDILNLVIVLWKLNFCYVSALISVLYLRLSLYHKQK